MLNVHWRLYYLSSSKKGGLRNKLEVCLGRINVELGIKVPNHGNNYTVL